MTRSEVEGVLEILNVAYPAFYSKKTDKELDCIENLWAEMFEEDDFNLVKFALKELIETHTGYPPDIAALKIKMKDIATAAMNVPTHEEYWHLFKKAVQEGYYKSQEEFDKLPKVVQRFLGSPYALREYGAMDEETFNTVVHGQFLKQIKVLEDRVMYDLKIPDSIRALVQNIYTPLEGEKPPMLENEVNDRRNEILNTIENIQIAEVKNEIY